mmetsp:Transcript_96959/g.269779  ORF Transcript_96959/g.269779 Transcript_96959/m.269779 type:complete len:277 (-) Transcript_96959:1229-2059(-)
MLQHHCRALSRPRPAAAHGASCRFTRRGRRTASSTPWRPTRWVSHPEVQTRRAEAPLPWITRRTIMGCTWASSPWPLAKTCARALLSARASNFRSSPADARSGLGPKVSAPPCRYRATRACDSSSGSSLWATRAALHAVARTPVTTRRRTTRSTITWTPSLHVRASVLRAPPLARASSTPLRRSAARFGPEPKASVRCCPSAAFPAAGSAVDSGPWRPRGRPPRRRRPPPPRPPRKGQAPRNPPWALQLTRWSMRSRAAAPSSSAPKECRRSACWS